MHMQLDLLLELKSVTVSDTVLDYAVLQDDEKTGIQVVLALPPDVVKDGPLVVAAYSKNVVVDPETVVAEYESVIVEHQAVIVVVLVKLYTESDAEIDLSFFAGPFLLGAQIHLMAHDEECLFLDCSLMDSHLQHYQRCLVAVVHVVCVFRCFSQETSGV